MSETLRYHISGMTCQACANRIEKVLNKKAAIENASVNFAGEEAQIHYHPTQTDAEEIQQWISKAGYTATLIEDDSQPLSNADTATSWRLWLLLALCLPFLLHMLSHLIGIHWRIPLTLQLLLASIVQLYLAIPFYRSAIASIKGGLANMDVLVSLGTGSIYLYSTLITLLGQAQHYPTYFDASIMVITFVSLGKHLEERSKRGTLNSLGELLHMTPEYIEKHTHNGWEKHPLASVQIGDTLRAHHGDRIAADGTLTAGDIHCNESHLTGEPLPVHKQIGDKVLAGALVSSGSGEYRADSLGKDTHLGDMINALAQAQGSKAPIARLADKVASIFVPIVISLATLTFLGTWLHSHNAITALTHAVAVLVIACPCAMGLATPAAIMVGMGQAVQHGIWFKNAAALETAGNIDTIVLDKTGTLTHGTPQIIAVHPYHDWQPHDLLSLAATLENHSNHPLAQAITAAAPARTATLHNLQTLAGKGIEANLDDIGHLKIGSPDYTDTPIPDGKPWQTASLVGINLNGEPIGIIAIADALKPDSHTAIKRLHQLGIHTIILSGDRQSTVDDIAQQLGITDAHGNLSPRDKADYIQRLKANGAHVAMVGDGINDAPALASANISFAMKGGTQLAEQTADATLMRHSVQQLTDALIIARATMRNIKQNLFFAFFYNCLGIPLAAVGLLNPIIAGAAMALSSLSVLANALRLKRLKL